MDKAGRMTKYAGRCNLGLVERDSGLVVLECDFGQIKTVKLVDQYIRFHTVNDRGLYKSGRKNAALSQVYIWATSTGNQCR